MKIQIKERTLKDGNKSLYLEYYLGYERTADGRIKHIRKKENLNLQLYKKPCNPLQKKANKENLELAEKVLIKKQAQINENLIDIFSSKKLNQNLVKYFEKIKDTKTSSESLKKHWINTINHLKRFCNPEHTTFKQVNESFVTRFKEYLMNHKEIHNNTASGYFEVFREGLKKAFKEGILKESPARNVKGIKKTDVKREYLTEGEIQSLASTECDNEKMKRAFLFACLTGLRWCDIYKLKWNEIEINNDKYKLVFRQQKTKGLEYFPLSKQAIELLGEPKNTDEKVFQGLKYTTDGYYRLQLWGQKAGIKKPLTFHMARHSFATQLITQGVDLYTVQKLLGHRFLRTTQIYAKIIDEKLNEAVNKIPEIKMY